MATWEVVLEMLRAAAELAAAFLVGPALWAAALVLKIGAFMYGLLGAMHLVGYGLVAGTNGMTHYLKHDVQSPANQLWLLVVAAALFVASNAIAEERTRWTARRGSR